ncbi:PREDICTED: protein FAM192A [Ipomoea nil]|uniref:protein FAM192A n=1 Tax=Ipomoea nil TaxID=35883 RepID=UPI0009020127|nr:PREDICTED: protein FAM192A [Ipomoea nil]
MAGGDGEEELGHSAAPVRLMNFVSEEQLEEARRSRGARVEDGTAQRDRSLYEILKENKDKKDAEFNERFKHRPPKALDEDETEFLDKLEASRQEYERQLVDEEAKQLRSFQAAVAAQSITVHELKEISPKIQEQRSGGRKNPPAKPLGMLIKVKPQVKKAKVDDANSEASLMARTTSYGNAKESCHTQESHGYMKTGMTEGDDDKSGSVANGSLVQYSDESDDE